MEPTWKQIEPRALALGDDHLYRKVQGQDLFAGEAQYHHSCRKAFNLKYINHLRDTKRKEEHPQTEQGQKASAHQKALEAVVQHVRENVVAKEQVVELRSLRILYVEELEKNGFPSPAHRSKNLKTKLEKYEIGELIAFAKMNPTDKGCITLTLVYNVTLGDAVAQAYKLGTVDKNQDVALPSVTQYSVRSRKLYPFLGPFLLKILMSTQRTRSFLLNWKNS